MQTMMRLWLMGVVLGAGAATAQSPPPPPPTTIPTPPVDYAAPATWLCRPGHDTICTSEFGAVAVDAAGVRAPRPMLAPADRPIDCFYVYPTVSSDPSVLSDLAFDPAEKRVVRVQAARLEEACRLFVPGYHQFTTAGLRYQMAGGSTDSATLPLEIPYRDVRDAWRYYLAHDNRGRGVVLIGHSQGAMLLKRLIAEEVDGKPAQKRLVGAYLAGNPDLTTQSFKRIRPCAAKGETGCIVAWSSYRADDATARRTFGGGTGAICVNPAAPGGGRGMLDAFLPRPAMAPPEDPPFVETKGQLSAECVADGQGAVLRVRAEPGRYQTLLEGLLRAGNSGWGLHTLDISLVEGNLIEDIAAQGAAWPKR